MICTIDMICTAVLVLSFLMYLRFFCDVVDGNWGCVCDAGGGATAAPLLLWCVVFIRWLRR